MDCGLGFGLLGADSLAKGTRGGRREDSGSGANDTDEWRRRDSALCGKATLPLVVRTAPSSASVDVLPFFVSSSVSERAGPASGDERKVCDFGLRPSLEKSAECGRGRVVAIAEGEEEEDDVFQLL